MLTWFYKEIEVYDTIIHDNIDREELWANMVTNLFNINFIKAEIRVYIGMHYDTY